MSQQPKLYGCRGLKYRGPSLPSITVPSFQERKRSSSSSSTTSSSSSSENENIIVQKLKKSIKKLKLNKNKTRKESTSSSATSSEYSHSSAPLAVGDHGSLKETRKKTLLAPKRRVSVKKIWKNWDFFRSDGILLQVRRWQLMRRRKEILKNRKRYFMIYHRHFWIILNKY